MLAFSFFPQTAVNMQVFKHVFLVLNRTTSDSYDLSTFRAKQAAIIVNSYTGFKFNSDADI